MPRFVDYPCPTNELLYHPLFGHCYFTKENGKEKLRSGETGLEVPTIGGDITKNWMVPPSGGLISMTYIFKLTLEGQHEGKDVSVVSTSQELAAKKVRAKLGLNDKAKIEFVKSYVDVATASFEEIKPDAFEGMQEAIQPRDPNDPKLEVPAEPIVETQEGFQPAQAETDPSAPIIPPEGSENDAQHPNG